MKKFFCWSVILALAITLAGTDVWAGRISKRQHKQDSRIAQGVKSGQLTCREAKSLVREQRRIRQATARAWSDGHLTVKEKARLELMQDRASHNIYRLKHNDKAR